MISLSTCQTALHRLLAQSQGSFEVADQGPLLNFSTQRYQLRTGHITCDRFLCVWWVSSLRVNRDNERLNRCYLWSVWGVTLGVKAGLKDSISRQKASSNSASLKKCTHTYKNLVFLDKEPENAYVESVVWRPDTQLQSFFRRLRSLRWNGWNVDGKLVRQKFGHFAPLVELGVEPAFPRIPRCEMRWWTHAFIVVIVVVEIISDTLVVVIEVQRARLVHHLLDLW